MVEYNNSPLMNLEDFILMKQDKNDHAAHPGNAQGASPPIQGHWGNQILVIQRLTSFLPTLKRLKWLIHDDLSECSFSLSIMTWDYLYRGKLGSNIRGHNAYC